VEGYKAESPMALALRFIRAMESAI